MTIIKTGGTVKNVDEAEGIVEGYFSAFGNLDSDGDIIEKGSYEKTIAERGMKGSNRIKHVIDHGSGVMAMLGRPELREDEKGLRFKTKISKTRMGKDVLQLYLDEVITEHSVRIEILESHMEENGTQRITEVKLWEGSSVVWGANPETPVIDVKSALEKQVRKLTKANRNGSYTDETHKIIEQTLKQLQTLREEADKAIEAMQPAVQTKQSTPLEVSGLQTQLKSIQNQLDNFQMNDK